MQKLRTGVIGVGYLGQFHAEKYTKLEGVELVGVADPGTARAAEVAKKLGVPFHADASALLGKVDAVSIVAPTVLHHRIARQFLDAGVHVLLEKPMTVTLEEADDLIALAATRKLVLQIGHIERFNPAVTTIRPLLRSPRYLQAERSAPFTVRCTDVNVVLDLMIHDLDIVTDLAASRPAEVSAAGASVITKELDAVTARILFENGCVADVTASRVSDEKKRVLRVFDGDTVYSVDFQTQKAVRSRPVPGPVPELKAEDLPSERKDTLFEEVAEFIRCVRGEGRPAAGGAEGRSALALATLITKSITEGRTGFVPVR